MKIYLETTVPNFLFADDAPQKRDATLVFWNWLKLGTEEIYTSERVLQELYRTTPEKQKKMLAALQELELTVLQADTKAVAFADPLIARGVIPIRFYEDALHIAIAVVNEMDVLASWNLQHIVKLKTMTAVNELCDARRLRPPRILTPEEIVP